MGIIIARFRKKPSTYDVLTKLENEIVSIEEFQKRTQQTQRKIVFRFVLLAILINVALAFLLYLYFSQISQNQKLIWCIPLIAFPLVIWIIKKFLTWYYNRKIGKNEKKLVTLKEKKKKLLENVMETETYKVAKKILDKFGHEPKKPIISTPIVQKYTPVQKTAMSVYESNLRQRNVPPKSLMRGRISFGGSPDPPRPVLQQQLALPSPGNRRSINVLPSPGQLAIPTAPNPLVRSILPRDRTVLDKMVDYLVGDGPSNRYALICQKCCSHNGMALKEEFEYLSFRCGYCAHFNPARKKKPLGPKFASPPTPASLSQMESSDSEKNSENDSESDAAVVAAPLITEPRSDSPDIRSSDIDKISESELQPEESKMEVEEEEESCLVVEKESNLEAKEESNLEVNDESHLETDEHNGIEDSAKINDLGERGDMVAGVDA